MFFFNDTATTEIYTLSLHDALPIYTRAAVARGEDAAVAKGRYVGAFNARRKAAYEQKPFTIQFIPEWGRSEEHTSELQSRNISYAVFCLNKKRSWRCVLPCSPLRTC